MPQDAPLKETVTLRRAIVADLDAVIPLNDAAVPAVNALPRETWERFVATAARFQVAEGADGRVLGFLVGMTPDMDYGSANFLWFRERFADGFAYVDRVVVDEAARGAGIGRAFYADMIDYARAAGVPRVTAEVNSRPPNPGSLRFHEGFGFRPVGEQETEGGAKAVVLLARPVAAE